jgi:hypothetical protein
MRLGPFQIPTPSRRQIMALSRGEYWRRWALAFLLGFLGRDWLNRSTNPLLHKWGDIAVVGVILAIYFSLSPPRRKAPWKDDDGARLHRAD